MKVLFMSSEIALVLMSLCIRYTESEVPYVFFISVIRASLRMKEDVYNLHLIIFMIKKILKIRLDGWKI